MNVLSKEDEIDAINLLKRMGYSDAAERIAAAKAELSAAIQRGALAIENRDGGLVAKVSDIKKIWPE